MMGRSPATWAAVHQSGSGVGLLRAWGGGRLPPKLSLSPPAGFVSWRDTTSGSWYIETLDGVLEQWAHCEDLLTLLLRVRLLAGAGGSESSQGGLGAC